MAHMRRQRRRTSVSSSGWSAHTSSGVRPNTEISSSNWSTSDSARISGPFEGGCAAGLQFPTLSRAGIQLDWVGCIILWAEVGKLLFQKPQAAGQPPLDRYCRDTEQLGSLD